jgi:hypothetical protein
MATNWWVDGEKTGAALSLVMVEWKEEEITNSVISWLLVWDKKISYNEWAASSTQLAFELAYNEHTASGVTNITPKMLKDSASGYFEKIVKLSGVNPDTMIQNSLGGKLPSWAEKLATKSEI